jgi:hypothetical protein
VLNEALRYLGLGWSIIPTCWAVDGACGCGRGHTGNDIGKAPLVKWTDYQTRRATVEEATNWWTNWPQANIACVTGTISKLVVVDLEYDGIAEAERLNLWSPLKAFTGKGYHLYFAHPGEGRICNAAKMKKIKGFDMRGDGGYVLLPPSRHATGRLYTWASAFSVGAPLPVFTLRLLAHITEKDSSTVAPERLAKPAGWIAEALANLGEGNRDNTFAQVVGKLHGTRWADSDIRSLLLPHALRVGYTETELDKTIRSISRYPVSIRPTSTLRTDGPDTGVLQAKLSIRTFAKDWAEYERRRAGTQSTEFATGYARFDSLINGGLVRERLLRVAARTGVGKTNWLLAMCRNLCGNGKRVLYLSTELSYETIWNRYIAIVGSAADARKHPFDVSDDFIPDIAAIRAAIEELKPDVFVFDHIHNVSEENAEVGRYIKELGQLAKDFRMPGVVAAQLNKNAYFIDEKTGKPITPHLGMVKGASAILQVPGQVLILDERDDTPEQREVLGVLDKNTDGEKGLVAFVLKKKPYRMEEA